MAYNNLTSRTDSAALIPEEVSKEMLGKATEQSAVLNMFRKVPVGRAQVRFPVLSALPVAYFVGGDTGLKQTTELNWQNKFLNIEEIATIMPVPDNVLADVDANIWDEAMPLLTEAFGRTLDAAVFFGTNAPSSWPSDITTAAAAAGNSVTEAATAAQGGFYGDLDNLYEKIELDGFEVNGFVAATSAKSKLRKARDSQGRKLDEARVSGSLDMIDGYPVAYSMRGLFPATGGAGANTRLFAGDWNQFVVGVRQDITMKVLTEAVIQDNTGAIIFNLAQQDMTAVRLTFRVGWQVANTINNEQSVEANRYPAGILKY
ncbi:phage major capsid protein [Streptomyces sp. H27-H1]|uniref:phage major capsid protein n=1 Tax=Streptomyces sp. H27-H1 TaxID=2996461 RepID=UPI00226EDA18|nr:phage major capsid protein [Streptomyces sp. H27-H1]MCY0928311.1 phage major capsid protein [Streptomyces sp. H27-H1]